MKESIRLYVNNREHTLSLEPDTPLLYVLRNDLKLNGPKFGCGLEQCGACKVLLDDEAYPTCRLPVAEAQGKKITTLEGLATQSGELHPVQQAFIQEQAAQCGYCTSGLIMASISLLNKNSNPDRDTIKQELQRNICRCGVHDRVIKAVEHAAKG